MFGIALGYGSLIWRARAFGAGDVETAEKADNLWGISALLVGGTGIARLMWTEKGTAFYMVHWAFHGKMAVLVLIGTLELVPMVLLLRYRMQSYRGRPLSPVPTAALARICWIQAALLLTMPVFAAAMARALAPPW